MTLFSRNSCQYPVVSTRFCSTGCEQQVLVLKKAFVTSPGCLVPVAPTGNWVLPLIRQLEHHVYDRGGIHRLAVTQSWFETDLVGCRNRGFIQAVSQSADHSIHMQ